MSLEQAIASLQAAVETLTGVIAAQSGAAAPAAAPAATPAAATKPTRAPKAQPAAPTGGDPFAEAVSSGETITAETVKETFLALRTKAVEKKGEADGVAYAKAVIAKFAPQLSAIPTEKWAEAKKAAEAASKALDVPADDL